MRGKRAFLQHHALELAPVVFEQFGRAEVARDQDRVAPQALAGGRAKLARDDPQQPVRQVLQIVHPVGQQRIVDLPHPHPGALLHPLDRRLGGEAGIDRLVDPAAPPLVVGEHLVGLEHLVVLSAHPEFGLVGHLVDLLAHLVERTINPLALGLDVVGHHLVDGHARLVEHRVAGGQPLDQRQPLHDLRFGAGLRQPQRLLLVDQFCVGDQFGQDHRGGLQRLDLDVLVPARLDMLHDQRADRAFTIDDRHPGEGMELLLPRFGAIGEIGMRLGFGQVERLDVGRDGAGKPLADCQPGDVDRALVQPAGGEQLQHPLAQQVHRAHLAIEALADDLDHPVEFALRVHARGHDLVQAREDGASGGGCGHGPQL
jgi:hypothetical protein